MMRSISAADRKKAGIKTAALLFWLIVWQSVSMVIGQEILLVSPVSVVVRLAELMGTQNFWSSVWFSFIRIASGFFLALIAGTGSAVLSANLRTVRILLAPLVSAVKSTPVASFIILCLIWVDSRNLSVIIAFLMVYPVVYINMLQGIDSADRQLLEMADVFRIHGMRRVFYIYTPQMMPYFLSACTVSLGLCWKSGVAAEVIGIPSGSIGEKLYQAKLFLSTADLLAWTLTIILVSTLFERLFLFLVRKIFRRIERM